MGFIHVLVGAMETTFFRVGVLVIAALSLLAIGYVLLVKSSDTMIPNRRR